MMRRCREDGHKTDEYFKNSMSKGPKARTRMLSVLEEMKGCWYGWNTKRERDMK